MSDSKPFRSVAIHLRPLQSDDDRPGDWSGWRRLRAALKSLLRGYRLRCTRLEFVDDDGHHEQSEQGGASE